MIENIFSIPIYKALVNNFNSVQDEISTVIKHAVFNNTWQPDNDTAHTTFDPIGSTNIISSYNMFNIGDSILNHANHYLRESKQQYVKESISIDQSWINTFKTEHLIGLHEHGYQPNTISGCYYYKAPTNCGKLIFKSPNPFVVSFPHQSREYYNLFTVEPKEGMLVMFPSWLLHKVEPNKSDSTRCSLAFNISFDYSYFKD